MSYILEALKKADQERSRGEIPDIRASHLVQEKGERYRRLAMALVVLVLCVQGLLLFLYLRTKSPPAVAPQALEAPATPLVTAPVAVPSVPAPPPDPARSASIVLEPPAVAVTEMPAPAAPAAPVRQAIADVPELSIDTWQQGSAAVQQFGASLSLDVHVYAEQPAQRFVLINMTRYREGDRLQEGAVLERITPQGMVLSYRGEIFRYDRP